MRDLIVEARELLERKKAKSKKPKDKMHSLQNWLKGATPAVKSYATAASLGSKRHFQDKDALAAMREVTALLATMQTSIAKLGPSVTKALKGL